MVGCHMSCRITGALAYADDITLLAPCKFALSIMLDVCEQYAAEFDILFNGSKSKLLFFKGRYASAITSGIMVNGEIVIYLTMLSIWAITFLQVIVTV